MQKILAFFCLIITNIAIAQDIEIVGKGNFSSEKKGKDFAFLETKTDTAQLQYVASFKATVGGKKSTVSDLFFKIKTQAQMLGANCFRLKSYSRDSTNAVMILDTYFGTDSLLNINIANHDKNEVFVFCSDPLVNEKYSINVNSEKKEFASGTYLKFRLKEGEELKLNKGGFTGATAWFTYKQNKPAVFMTITGFGLGGPESTGTLSMSFNTGRFNRIDENLGQLLTQVLKQSE